MSIHRTLAVAASVLLVALPVAASAKTIPVTARLQGSYEVPANMSHAHGRLSGRYDTTTHELSWKVTYSGLTGPATAAHFHGPAPVGKSAGVQVPIAKRDLASPIKGQARLSTQQSQQLLDGQWYFNVHTAKHPKGEIRGQVMVEGSHDAMAPMHGMDHKMDSMGQH